METQTDITVEESGDDSPLLIETYEELRERMAQVDGHRSPCAMDW